MHKEALCMKESYRHIWNFDCIAICTVLGFTLDDRQIDRLCRKHELPPDKGPLDAAYGFYLVHHSSHVKRGTVAKRLTKLLDERYAGMIQMVRRMECGDAVVCGNDEEIAAKLGSWTRKCPGGVMWALLTDRRERFQQHGMYLVHQVAYAAFRDAQGKSKAVEEDDDGLAAAQRDLRLSRSRFAQQKTEADKLRRRLAQRERDLAELRAAHQQQERRIAELEESPGRNERLRRRVRMLEHELESRRESECAALSGPDADSHEEPQAETLPPEVGAPHSPQATTVYERTEPSEPAEAGCSSCRLEDQRVAIIGGLDRLEPHYRRVVESFGARFSFHNGDCHGTGRVLRSVVCESDVIVFITRVNSHAALRVVRGLCRKSGRRFTALRETSPQALTRALQEVA
jgi:hypothetical protein